MARRRPSDVILNTYVANLGPTKGWEGNCYAIACKAVTAGLAPGGVAVYGHWTGPRHPESMFYHPGLPFVPHGWILMPDRTVCDPTRWVFEHVDPYIYIGAADHYDEGGNLFRSRIFGRPPAFDDSDRTFLLTKSILEGKAFSFVEKLLRLADAYDRVEPGTISLGQLFWLANRPPQEFGEHAPAILRAIDGLDQAGLVPCDNRTMIERMFPKEFP